MQALFSDLVGTAVVSAIVSNSEELIDLAPTFEAPTVDHHLTADASEAGGTNVTGCYSTYCR